MFALYEQFKSALSDKAKRAYLRAYCKIGQFYKANGRISAPIVKKTPCEVKKAKRVQLWAYRRTVPRAGAVYKTKRAYLWTYCTRRLFRVNHALRPFLNLFLLRS